MRISRFLAGIVVSVTALVILGFAFAGWEAKREGASVKWIFALPIVEVKMPLGGLKFAVYFEDYDGSHPRLYVHRTVYPFTPHWYLAGNNGEHGEYCASSLWPFSNPEKDCRPLTDRERTELTELFNKGGLQAVVVRKSPDFPYR